MQLHLDIHTVISILTVHGICRHRTKTYLIQCN